MESLSNTGYAMLEMCDKMKKEPNLAHAAAPHSPRRTRRLSERRHQFQFKARHSPLFHDRGMALLLILMSMFLPYSNNKDDPCFPAVSGFALNSLRRTKTRQGPCPEDHQNIRQRFHVLPTLKASMAYNNYRANGQDLSSNLIDIDEMASRDIATLQEWALSYGVQTSPGFQLEYTANINQDTLKTEEDGMDNNDVSVITTEDIAASQPVLYVPEELIWTGAKAREQVGVVPRAEDLLKRFSQSANQLPQFYLMLQLLQEYEKGTDSPWHAWLTSLPKFYSNGVSMTHFCCTECLPIYVGHLSNQERIRFIQFFRALKECAPILSDATQKNRALAKWAFCAVYTRCFVDEPTGDVRMAPMADMFNHGSDCPEIELNWDNDGNCYGYSTYDIPAGTPLRISYGETSSNGVRIDPSRLFARYGFLDEKAPTFCKIMISNPSQELVQIGYDPAQMLFHHNGEVAPQVWNVLLFQLLQRQAQEQQFDDNGNDTTMLLQQFYQSCVEGDWETQQEFHQHYQDQTFQTLLDHVDTFLRQLDLLSAKTFGRDPNTHPRLPLIRQHNDFVKTIFLAVRRELIGSG